MKDEDLKINEIEVSLTLGGSGTVVRGWNSLRYNLRRLKSKRTLGEVELGKCLSDDKTTIKYLSK